MPARQGLERTQERRHLLAPQLPAKDHTVSITQTRPAVLGAVRARPPPLMRVSDPRMKINGEFLRVEKHVEYLLINDQKPLAMFVLNPL